MTKKVLIVEDERDVAALIADVLGLDGFATCIASGEDALDEALSFTPDVVLLDLMMPVVDGFEVARLLRTDARTRGIPIIVMTAMHDAAGKAAELSSRYYLSKPFDIERLTRIVNAALSDL